MSQKTKREWLETLPDGYRQRAIANAEKHNPTRMDIQFDSLEKAIGGSFVWDSTPEGQSFWSAVAGGSFPPLPVDPATVKPKKSNRPTDLEVPAGWRELSDDEKGPIGANWIVGAKFAGYGGGWKYNEYAAERETKGPGCFPERWSRIIIPIVPTVEANPYIPWSGGECPVPKGTLVDVRYKDGTEILGQKAREWTEGDKYSPISWAASCGPATIVAYRLHKPEPAVVAPPVDPYAELKQAHKDGKTIELLMGGYWSVRKKPDWTCPPEKYRVQPTAVPKWHNPENVQLNKVPSGWRFMVEEEVDGRHKGQCQMWWNAGWDKSWLHGNDKTSTYIVPVTIPIPGEAVAVTPATTPPPKWTLPPPPSDRQWHRDDWTEDMLPEGWRPLLADEKIELGDMGTATGRIGGMIDFRSPHGLEEVSRNLDKWHVRTRRPLPDSSTATITLPHIPQPDSWIPWSGKDYTPPVDKATRVEVRKRCGEIMTDIAGRWSLCWKDDGNYHDIIAYRVLEVPAPTPVQQPTTPAHPPLPDGYELYTGPKDGRYCRDSLYFAAPYKKWLPNTILSDYEGILYAIPVTKPDWHNPENVPMDKIPDGWRLRTKKEAGIKATSQCRVWDGDRFSAETHYAGTAKEWTYIVPIDTPAQQSPQPRNPTEQEQTPVQTTQETQTQQQTQHTIMTTNAQEIQNETPKIGSQWMVDGTRLTVAAATSAGIALVHRKDEDKNGNFTIDLWKEKIRRGTVLPIQTKTSLFKFNRPSITKTEVSDLDKAIRYYGTRWTRAKRFIRTGLICVALWNSNNPVVKATAGAGWNAAKAFVTSLWS